MSYTALSPSSITSEPITGFLKLSYADAPECIQENKTNGGGLKNMISK